MHFIHRRSTKLPLWLGFLRQSDQMIGVNIRTGYVVAANIVHTILAGLYLY